MRLGVFFVFLFLFSNSVKGQEKILKGKIQGTTYSIRYLDSLGRDFQNAIDIIFNDIDSVFSLYRDDSEIARFNSNLGHSPSSDHFKKVVLLSKQVHDTSNGLFDPTLYPLTKLYKENKWDTSLVQTYQEVIGFDKIEITQTTILKKNPHVGLDLNGIVQGYTVDEVARLFDAQNLENYLIEIGGEIRVKGVNSKGNSWRIGIVDPLKPTRLKASVTLLNKSAATSGNYRDFKSFDSRKVGHILHPSKGFLLDSNIISVTVVCQQAALADAYATAINLMNLTEIENFVKNNSDIDVYILYLTSDNVLQSYTSKGIKNVLVEYH